MVVNSYSDKISVNGYPFNYKEKMRLIIVSVLFGLTAHLVMKENVIFQKVKEVTTVRARWMVTFVEDLLPFEGFRIRHKYYRCSLTSCPQIPGDTCALQSGKKKLDINGIRCK